MPRIVDRDNMNVDLCVSCYDEETWEQYVCDVMYPGADFDVEHPPYSDDIYHCEACGKQLTDQDNHPREFRSVFK